jgi:hypothetical protein
MDTLIDYLAEAREAHQRNDWRASYAAFVRADGLGPMPTDDLNAYSVTAWRLGYQNEAVRLAERTFDRLTRTDPAAAAMKAAELALLWHARGHHTVSHLWADRARGLLSGATVGPTHGYLAYLDAAIAAAAEDADTLARASSLLQEAASVSHDAMVVLLGRVVEGVAALLGPRVADGYHLLDDALMPMLDERLSLEWAGDIYRLVLHQGHRVDARHREAWTESMRRWVVVTGVVMSNP